MNLQNISLLAHWRSARETKTGLAQTSSGDSHTDSHRAQRSERSAAGGLREPRSPAGSRVCGSAGGLRRDRAWSTGPIRPIPRSGTEWASTRAAWPSALLRCGPGGRRRLLLHQL